MLFFSELRDGVKKVLIILEIGVVEFRKSVTFASPIGRKGKQKRKKTKKKSRDIVPLQGGLVH